jgi:extracellular factor (EF) 3-hydroxypalmitic acid methyl ester biosynthesis protein
MKELSANMEKPALKESFITCCTSQGTELRAAMLRLTRYEAVFEIYNPACVLLSSEILSEFKILLQDRTVYSGRASIKHLVNTGPTLVCEATLEEFWLDGDFFSGLKQGPKLRDECAEFFRRWQKLYRVVPEYKLIVADMQSFLMELRLWLNQVELGIRSTPSGDRLQLEQDVIKDLEEPITPIMAGLFERFEAVAEGIEASLRPVHMSYAKRQLHPLILCSPFAYRTYSKPLGFAGDYEMVNMLVRNPCEGSSLFAKVLNLWFLLQPPARAHRSRIDYLVQRLFEETARVSGASRPARVLNLACGPAIEVQRFLAEKEISERADLTLIDFNEETLQHAGAKLGEIKARFKRSTPVQFVKKSVHQILKETGKSIERSPELQYDFIYCTGLFDYLSDQVCKRLMTAFYQWLAPGGLLLATNVHPSNPIRNGIEHLLDWNLVYRTARQALGLRPEAVAPDDFSVKSEATGVNLFLEARKSNDA